MYRKSERNMVFGILALLVAVSAITLAYAGFTQTLNITGSGKVVSSKWDIHFENLSNASLNGSARVVTAPTITSATTIGTYSVQLLAPGDSVSYTFDVVNDGNFNALLTTLTKNNPSCTTGFNCNNLTYSLKYVDGDTNVSNGDSLNVGETKTMKLTLSFNASNNSSVLATSDSTVSNLGITLLYSQEGLYTVAPTPAQSSANYVYTISTTTYNIGGAAPTLQAGTTVNSEEAIVSLIQSNGYYAFIRYTVDGSGNITESYVGFTNDSYTTVYYLKGYDTSAYTSNQSVITAYNNAGGGSANPDAIFDGRVKAGGDSSYCYVSNDGYSRCILYAGGGSGR